MTDRSQFNKDCQKCVTSLASVHLAACRNHRCFARDGYEPKWFCVLPSDLESECIPDSLQPGHGIRLEVADRSVSGFKKVGAEKYIFVADCGPSRFKIICNCPGPAVHPHLMRVLCKCYNAN
ncbi:E3 12.5K [bottlenose dolphin adenovirus 2]|uniref:E3 12.5K n=1 Tax=bottlenose dolphin adenovirus 2 TaxID=2849592 RepID=A0A0M5KXY3_9ADEN|nr:E3 12.5K [Bottlenose dolphin adenovirus 1]ALE15311.1 E3 12.5K [Bottlenose dolphin adenovirus 1]